MTTTKEYIVTLRATGIQAVSGAQARRLGHQLAEVANQSRLRAYGVNVEVVSVTQKKDD